MNKINIWTCNMLSTLLITSWSFKKSALPRACPIISAHLCTIKTYCKTRYSKAILRNMSFYKILPDWVDSSASADIHPVLMPQIQLESYDQPTKRRTSQQKCSQWWISEQKSCNTKRKLFTKLWWYKCTYRFIKWMNLVGLEICNGGWKSCKKFWHEWLILPNL